MIRTALVCRKHMSTHTKTIIIHHYRLLIVCVCVRVRFCLDCGCQMLKIYRSMFATIHLNLHMDNRLTDLLRGFRASPLIWCCLNLGGQNWPWPAGTKQSVLSLYVCVYVHIRKLYTGQVPQIKLLDFRVHERVCNCMPDRMCSSSLSHPGEAQFPFLSLLFSFCHYIQMSTVCMYVISHIETLL